MLAYEIVESAAGQFDAALAEHKPVLVLLHAFPLHRETWLPCTQLLSEAMPCVLIDLPGCGQSQDHPVLSQEPSLSAITQAVLESCDALGLDTAFWAGVSLGGYVLMNLAASDPHRIAGLALIDTKADADPPEAARLRRAVAHRVLSEEGIATLEPMPGTLLGTTTQTIRPELVRQVRDWVLAAQPETVAWLQRAMAARGDSHAALGQLSAQGIPARVLMGAEDTLVTAEQVASMAAALGLGAHEIISVPNAGHLAPLEEPGAVAHALMAAFAQP